jgi:hypothetical protein
MANVLIAHIAGSAIVLWTDANPGDENYSRRNFIPVGTQCVVLHDDLLPWLPIIQSILANPALSALPADQLADTLSQQLRSLPNAPVNSFGLIIAGFVANSSPALLGLHSAQTYTVRRYPTSVSAGVLPAIWNYLLSVLQTIPKTLDNVIDMCLIAGLAYREVQQFSMLAFPVGSTIAIVSPSQNLYWMPEAEIEQRQAHNNRRLHALRLSLTNQLQGFSR